MDQTSMQNLKKHSCRKYCIRTWQEAEKDRGGRSEDLFQKNVDALGGGMDWKN